MKTHEEVLKRKYLLLLKIDSKNLLNRIDIRFSEVMDDFSLKRDRSIFKEIFFSRYEKMTMSELAHLSSEIIELANYFYQSVNELYWYVSHTQDMPNTIEDEATRACTGLRRQLGNLSLYMDAELGGADVVLEGHSLEHLHT
jgi:hypothetical protein